MNSVSSTTTKKLSAAAKKRARTESGKFKKDGTAKSMTEAGSIGTPGNFVPEDDPRTYVYETFLSVEDVSELITDTVQRAENGFKNDWDQYVDTATTHGLGESLGNLYSFRSACRAHAGEAASDLLEHSGFAPEELGKSGLTVTSDDIDISYKITPAKARYAEKERREQFLKKTRKSGSVTEVRIDAQILWRDSSWDAGSLVDMGIDLDDISVKGATRAAIIPETNENLVGVYREGLQGMISGLAFNPDVETHDGRMSAFIYAKRLEESTNERIGQIEQQFQPSIKNGLRTIKGTRKSNGYSGDVIGEVRRSTARSGWNASKILDELESRSDGDPERYARLILQARPRGGYRGSGPSGFDSGRPPNVRQVKPKS